MTKLGEVELPYQVVACLHQHPQCCGGSIPNGDPVVLNYAIPGPRIEPSFVGYKGRSQEPWSENAVRCACDPSGVGGAPVSVLFPKVKDVPGCVPLLDHGLMAEQDPLWLSCGPRGIVDDIGIGGCHVNGLVVGIAGPDDLFKLHGLLTQPLVVAHNDELLHIHQVVQYRLQSLVQVWGGDEEPGAAVKGPVLHGFRT